MLSYGYSTRPILRSHPFVTSHRNISRNDLIFFNNTPHPVRVKTTRKLIPVGRSFIYVIFFFVRVINVINFFFPFSAISSAYTGPEVSYVVFPLRRAIKIPFRFLISNL